MKKPPHPYEMKYSLDCLPKHLPAWYRKHHRMLPWRDTGDPYDVWLSEIMLQQTRVAAVIAYFLRFKDALPDIAALAACDEERLLKLWEGLGYYSRVRNLQKAARMIMEQYDGNMPECAAELQKLPGIGSYTAGAIASIAFGEAVPAVDGNVLRICARISGNTEDIALPDTKNALEGKLAEVFAEMSVPDPGELNQAMMELGATVCVPNGPPLCEQCPVAESCYAHLQKETEALPVKSGKKPRRIEQLTVLRIMDGEDCLIRKRPQKGLLAGLWELPSLPGYVTEKEALDAAKEILSRTGGQEAVFIQKLPLAKHVFTHVEWQMQGYLIRVAPALRQVEAEAAGETTRSGADAGVPLFANPAELRSVYSLPAAFGAYLP